MTGKRELRDSGLMTLIRAIAGRESAAVAAMLAAAPRLAGQALFVGATRASSSEHYFEEIGHHVYAGDTALHVAAAAHDRGIAVELLALGANASARNRRGSGPLHYAADGSPGSRSWNPEAQAAVVECLIQAGADPNGLNKDGVTPLHRAVRTRCASAVRVLLANGAEVTGKNANGATPLHLAVQGTGRGGAGSPEAQAEQKAILLLLLKGGARPRDKDAKGKTVRESATTEWVRELLEGWSA